MTNRVFITELWNGEEVGNSGLTMNDVSKFVSAEITKGTADLVKIDGSRAMTGNFTVDKNALVNFKTFFLLTIFNLIDPQI